MYSMRDGCYGIVLGRMMRHFSIVECGSGFSSLGTWQRQGVFSYICLPPIFAARCECLLCLLCSYAGPFTEKLLPLTDYLGR